MQRVPPSVHHRGRRGAVLPTRLALLGGHGQARYAVCAVTLFFFLATFLFFWLSRIALVKTAIKKLKSNVLAQRSRSISLLKIRSTGAIIVLGTQRAPFISRVQVALQALMN